MASQVKSLCFLLVLLSLTFVGVAFAVDIESSPPLQKEQSNAVFLLIIFVSMALVISFLCSVAETVLLSITPSYIEGLGEKNPEQAKQLKLLRQEKIDRSLAAILTMNTVAHTVGAIEAGAQSAVIFGSAWVGVFSGIMTLMILFLSEIICLLALAISPLAFSNCGLVFFLNSIFCLRICLALLKTPFLPTP
ncbi:hypothetical protein LCGC14_3082200, partial [marine sediment metagenome]